MAEAGQERLTLIWRRLVRVIGVPLIACAAAIGLAQTSWLQAIENIYYDYWHIISGVRYVPQHAAFVTVDDDTLVTYKDDPLAFWAPHFGQAMDVLTQAGAKAVGLDFIYQVSAESWLKKLKLPDSEISRNYDSPMRAALASGNKILITHLVELSDGSAELLMPPDDQRYLLPGGNNDLGIANLVPDDDKYVRTFYPIIDPNPAVPGVSFGMQLALRGAGKDPTAGEWDIAGVTLPRVLEKRRIGYTGPPGTIPTVSMKLLLQPDALANPAVLALKDKVVILAANNAGTSDRHFTPYSRGAHADQMAGGEIHANIVETIMSGRYQRDLPQWLFLAYLLLVLFLATLLFLRMQPERGALIGLLFAVNLPIPAFFAFRYEWVLPVAEPQAGLAVAFLMTVVLRLTGEEREKARLRNMFDSYVSEEVVHMLLSEGRKLNLGGEQVNVTVMFSDIRNFTTISEKLQATEVVEMLNAYFSSVTVPILEQGGYVNKYIGDAVMAVFGSPVHYPDHARRALIAGLGMVKKAEEFRGWMEQRFPDRGLPPFAIGIGIHSGDAVMGNIGSVKRLEFTAIGDTVNAASRLEGVTKDMECPFVASAQTVRAAGDGVRTGKFETVQVKGRAEPIEVYEILGVDAPPGG